VLRVEANCSFEASASRHPSAHAARDCARAIRHEPTFEHAMTGELPEGVSEGLREHVRDPRHVAAEGAPPDGTFVVRAINAACGDELELRGRREGPCLRLAFRARGCWGVVAVASLLCERLDGAPLAAARELDAAAAVAAAGGLPRSRAHAVHLFERVLADLVRGLERST
jgi:NifU-like protein involved in Fe-S cluster formation